ncbi:hypothetical protein E4U32_003654 [Claviceps aff. humidiphila group G2b]|nr:hypothetical protein E4U32_003654 [Claviceps aff. humidiphila group G2b]
MKFSTVLGTFALSILEAYRVYANPIDPVSPEAQSLEARTPEYCCMRIQGHGFARSQFVPFVGGVGGRPGRVRALIVDNGCVVYVEQGSTPPSQGGCSGWIGRSENCPGGPPLVYSMPAESCQMYDKI